MAHVHNTHTLLLYRQHTLSGASAVSQAARRTDHKLVINGFTGENWPEGRKPLAGDDAMFLSDLDADPGESKNLRRLHPALADELATLAHRWKKSLEGAL